MKQRIFAAAIAAALTLTSVAVALDASLSAYQPVAGLSGQLKSVGSETLGREMERWAEGFMRRAGASPVHPVRHQRNGRFVLS
jgi:phosphate transport system substrate-binding protein